MNQLGRNEFIRKTAMTLAATALIPKFLLGKNSLPFPARERASVNDLGIIDLHCHPSLKMYLWNKKIWKRDRPSSGTNLVAMQYTVDELAKGYVKGLLVAHYLVEAAFESESAVLHKLFPLIKRLFPGLAD